MNEKKGKITFKSTIGFIVSKIVSPIGILASVGLAIGALVIVLVATQVQDCTKEEVGFATIVYHVSTLYDGYATFITNAGEDFPIEAFFTSRNEDVHFSIRPGRYNIHEYYVDFENVELMRDLVRTGLYLPSGDTYDAQDVVTNLGLCNGDEYHILAWIQP